MNFIQLSTVMINATLQAGDKVMKVYAQSDFGVQMKADKSPVTIADKAAHHIIHQMLSDAFPQVDIISEEDEQNHAHGLDKRQQRNNGFFLVDPLDGTREFIKKNGEFSINIAYLENGIPTHGVIYVPAQSRLFYTMPDGRAFEEKRDFQNKTSWQKPTDQCLLKVKKTDNEALNIVTSRSYRKSAVEAYINQYNVKNILFSGSSLKLCMIAAGEADLYPRLGTTMEWDTAAGDAILRKSGGYILGFNDHLPLTYGKPRWKNTSFLACSQYVKLNPADKE